MHLTLYLNIVVSRSFDAIRMSNCRHVDVIKKESKIEAGKTNGKRKLGAFIACCITPLASWYIQWILFNDVFLICRNVEQFSAQRDRESQSRYTIGSLAHYITWEATECTKKYGLKKMVGRKWCWPENSQALDYDEYDSSNERGVYNAISTDDPLDRWRKRKMRMIFTQSKSPWTRVNYGEEKRERKKKLSIKQASAEWLWCYFTVCMFFLILLFCLRIYSVAVVVVFPNQYRLLSCHSRVSLNTVTQTNNRKMQIASRLNDKWWNNCAIKWRRKKNEKMTKKKLNQNDCLTNARGICGLNAYLAFCVVFFFIRFWRSHK